MSDTPRKAGPEGWPSNQPPADKADWAEILRTDAAAGFEITDDFEPFDQRDDAFCRAWWDPAVKSEHTANFFHSYRMESVPRQGEGFNQKDFALRNASWALADDFAERNREGKGLREGFLDPLEPYLPKADTQVPVSDASHMSSEIKRIARLFGADLVGITAYDPRWTYKYRADVKRMAQKPNQLPAGITGVIVMAHAMDFELVRTYPSALAGASTGLGYSKEAATAVLVSQYLRNLGYEAVASMNDTSLVIPYAIKAGLGEYGRNQLVITREFGPRVRFSKIFTDLPLAFDAPRRSGVKQTCDICTRCADACPPKALPTGAPAEGGPNRSNIKGVVKWTADCEKCFGYWAKLKSDCAICLRVCPYNQDYSTRAGRLIGQLLGGPLRRVGLWLDDLSDRNKRVKPSDWWNGPS